MACETCGACCRGWLVKIRSSDSVPEQLHDGSTMKMKFENGSYSCIALGQDNRCTIYNNRPQTCRDFQYESKECKAALDSPDGKDRILALRKHGVL